MYQDKTYINNCKIVNTISSPQENIKIGVGTLPVMTIPRKHMSSFVIISADDAQLLNQRIDLYDIAVMDAIYAFSLMGKRFFTPHDVVRAMFGESEQDVTKSKIINVQTSIDKLSMIRFTINCTDEYIEYEIVPKDEKVVEVTGYLLAVNKIRVRPGNNSDEVVGYELLDTPILHKYAAPLNQIIPVPIALFTRTPHCSNTDDFLLLKRYIIKRIEQMLNPKNKIKSTVIAYNRYDASDKCQKGLFPDLGITPNKYVKWRKKKNSVHRDVVNILNQFVSLGYIDSYIVQKAARGEVTGIEIKLKP